MQPLDAGDPTRIGPYAILGVLGSGGMGKVYLGRSTGGRTVAVKAVRPELADDAGFRVRFRNEVEAAKSVSGAFTAAVVDADTEAPVPWFATAFIAGISLGEAVTRFGPLPEPALRTLAAGLTEAIAAIHRTGIIHRDLKPANVLLALDGPYVIDFGITRATEGTALTTAGTVMGSPGFMSPEQASGIRVGPETDMFSLGATLVFAATGRSPFGDGPTPALLYRVVSTDPDITGVPESLRDMISACLSKEPARRPTTQQISDYLAHNAPAPTTGGWLPPAYTDAIVAASNVMTHMGAMPGPAGHLNPQQPPQGYGPGPNTTPPHGSYPQYGPTAQSGVMAMGGMGPNSQGGMGGPGGPGGTGGKVSRRALIGLVGGGVVLLGGGTAAALALSGGDKKPNPPGPTTGTGSGPTTAGSSGDTGPTTATSSSGGAPSTPDNPATGGGQSPTFSDPNTPQQVTIGGNAPQGTAWTQQTTDEIWGTALSKDTLLLIGTDKTHGLNMQGQTKWPDIDCGSGTVGILTAMDGTTVYCSGLNGKGDEPIFAIDIETGHVLWQVLPDDHNWSPQGAAGVLGDQVIVSANINVQGDGVMAIDKNKHTILWKANTPRIGSVTVPAKGNLIFVGAKTPGDDNSNTITALDITQKGKEVWHFDQKYATLGSAGESFFACTDKFVILGGEKLTALDIVTGKPAWQARVGNPDGSPSICDGPIVDGKGRVFVTADEYLAAVDATNGKVLWQGKAPNQFSISNPFTVADDTVYCTDYKGTLYAIDANSGATKWAYSNALVSGQTTMTLTAGNGKVFYTAGRAVMAFNSNGK